MFAVAVNKRKIVAEGGNQYHQTHPLQAHWGRRAGDADSLKRIYLHAEINILAQLYRLRKTCTGLYIAGITSKGEVIQATPCKICSMALSVAGIENIFATDKSFSF